MNVIANNLTIVENTYNTINEIRNTAIDINDYEANLFESKWIILHVQIVYLSFEAGVLG